MSGFGTYNWLVPSIKKLK